MLNTILEASGLVKKFGDFVAVKDVSFTMQEGDVFGLLGPNGAGVADLSVLLHDGFCHSGLASR